MLKKIARYILREDLNDAAHNTSMLYDKVVDMMMDQADTITEQNMLLKDERDVNASLTQMYHMAQTDVEELATQVVEAPSMLDMMMLERRIGDQNSEMIKQRAKRGDCERLRDNQRNSIVDLQKKLESRDFTIRNQIGQLEQLHTKVLELKSDLREAKGI